MTLSRDAAEFAAEIRDHFWGDAPWRMDRAGHQQEDDKNPTHTLDAVETRCLLTNVVFVTGQVLRFRDPGLDLHEYARACGVPAHQANGGTFDYGFRWADKVNGLADSPGRENKIEGYDKVTGHGYQ